jgi:hypothetical protein
VGWQSDPEWLTKSYGSLRENNFTSVVGPDRDDPKARTRLVDALQEAIKKYNQEPAFVKYTVFKDEVGDRRAINELLEVMAGVSVDSSSPTPPDSPPKPVEGNRVA